MNDNIRSHNSTIGATSREFLIPTGAQALIYALVSIILLITLNLPRAWRYLNNVILADQGGINRVIQESLPQVHSILNSLLQSVILQVTFWVFVGSLIYIVIWFAKNVAINLTNDVVADNYIHPSSYNKTSFWASVLARKFFFGVSAVVLVLYLYAGLKLLPLIAKSTYYLIVDFKLVDSTIEITGFILTTILWLHILLLIIHTVINSWRLIYKDL